MYKRSVPLWASSTNHSERKLISTFKPHDSLEVSVFRVLRNVCHFCLLPGSICGSSTSLISLYGLRSRQSEVPKIPKVWESPFEPGEKGGTREDTADNDERTAAVSSSSLHRVVSQSREQGFDFDGLTSYPTRRQWSYLVSKYRIVM